MCGTVITNNKVSLSGHNSRFHGISDQFIRLTFGHFCRMLILKSMLRTAIEVVNMTSNAQELMAADIASTILQC